jgi:hypothetical protein
MKWHFALLFGGTILFLFHVYFANSFVQPIPASLDVTERTFRYASRTYSLVVSYGIATGAYLAFVTLVMGHGLLIAKPATAK